MPTVFNPSMLRPGDAILYRPSDLLGWIIAIKTWTRLSHVEIYCGEGKSLASRGNKTVNCSGEEVRGVSLYPLRLADLACVLRPNQPFVFEKGLNWFWSEADGQGYDVLGLLCFTLAVHQGAPDKMFCSEFATRFFRQCDFKVFSESEDADHISPAQFVQTPALDRIWSDAVTI